MLLRSLRTLVTIEETGSFLKAADRLAMTLSAVSMQMRTLESELKVSLFDRTVRPPMLTPIGKSVVEQARVVLNSRDRLLALCADTEELRGDFLIGFVPTASIRLLPNFLINARDRYPNARFSFETALSTELARKVYHRKLDAAVLTRVNDENSKLRLAPILEEEFVFALPPSSQDMTLSECIDEMPFIQFLPQAGVGRILDNYMRRNGLAPKHTIVLDSVEAVVECVNAGVGFTGLIKEDILRYGRKDLKLLPMQGPPLTRELSLVTLRGSEADTYADKLLGLFGVGARSDGFARQRAAPASRRDAVLKSRRN